MQSRDNNANNTCGDTKRVRHFYYRVLVYKYISANLNKEVEKAIKA